MKAHLIYNPVAGPWNVRPALKKVTTSLKHSGWEVVLRLTERPGDATTLACEAVQAGCDVAVVVGGDGTVNEAVNGLVGTQTALAVLPAGTGNMWAKQLGLATYTLIHPFRLREAAANLTEATIRPVDVGRVNGRYFLCWAGIGLDAQVTTEMEPRRRSTKRLGALPYAIAAVLVACDFRGVYTRIWLDGEIVRGRALLILVANIQQYTMFNVAREARIDDGLFDVFLFKGLGISYAAGHLLKIISQRYLRDPEVVHRQARRVEIRSQETLPVQVDGDPIGATPVTLEIVPCALRVLVPPNAPSALFTS